MNATKERPAAPPKATRPTVFDVELGVPALPTPVVIEVEAATADEAKAILTEYFRRGLRVVPRA